MTDLTPEEYADKEAGFYFDRAVAPQDAAFTEETKAIAHMHGPYWDRKRWALERRWNEATKEARGLFNRTRECVLVTGQVSDAISEEWDRLIARHAMQQQAAE
jgi:hypothetical protein